MPEHTPGPWVVGNAEMRDPGCIVIHTISCESIASAWNLLLPDGTGPNTPIEKNAFLIAAAPDLLAACESAADLLLRCDAEIRPNDLPAAGDADWDAVAAMLKAAISKAKGGS